MEASEVLFTMTMIGACAMACVVFAFLLGSDHWQLFVGIALIYFVFTFIGYLKSYGETHYANVR